MKSDLYWMQRALALAEMAEARGEVPVGALIVCDDELIGEGYNQPISLFDPTAHAEVMALRDAGKRIGNYRLINCKMYVTIEPCAMCAGALVHARLQKVIFGAFDERAGACGSVMNVCEHPLLNHRVNVQSGVMAQEAAALMKAFFKQKR